MVMNRQRLIFGAAIGLAVALTGCDKVDCPYEDGCDNVVTNVIHFEDTFKVAAQSDYRVVLMEEFTGHTCTVCPTGARKIEDLLVLYGDTLLTVGIHGGTFAIPESGPAYTTDFRCSTSETVYDFFLPPGNPTGMISRVGPEGSKALPFQAWETEINTSGITGLAPIASIELTTLYDDSSNSAGAMANLTWLDAPVGNYRIQFYLLESHIIDWQLDNGVDDSQYEHNHVLRAGMNGDWGTDVTITEQGESELFTADYQMEDNWVKANCEVIAFVYNTDTYEIFQANHAHMPE